MYNSNIPSKVEIPSTKKLLCSTAMALCVACVLLVTTVLPAEFGIDPTGIGDLLGLTPMGEIKVSLAQEKEAESVPKTGMTSVIEQTGKTMILEGGKQDEISFVLARGQAAEVKLSMKKGTSTQYEWTANGPLNFDTHGDPVNAPKGFYHGYGKGRGVPGDKGTLTAAFDGKHGWFWRNRSGKKVTLTLKTKGRYQAIQRVL